jgi:HPt (histidine-containing phosphotransfer) domain-containing protein
MVPADLSHALRTPMLAILGTAEALLAGDLSPDQRRRVEAILTSGESLLTLLDDRGEPATLPAAMPAAVEPLCLARLQELDRSGSVLADVVESFASEMPRRLDQIRQAESREDRLAVGHLAHSLKGSCLLIGALRLADHCSALEEHARGASLSLIRETFAALQNEAKRVSAALAPYRPAAFAGTTHQAALGI